MTALCWNHLRLLITQMRTSMLFFSVSDTMYKAIVLPINM